MTYIERAAPAVVRVCHFINACVPARRKAGIIAFAVAPIIRALSEVDSANSRHSNIESVGSVVASPMLEFVP